METIEYYIMRHAAYYDYDNQFITYYGMLDLKVSMDRLKIELLEKFPNKNLRIIHSSLPRATHTALLVMEMINFPKSQRLRQIDSRLNNEKLLINHDYAKEVVSLCEKNNEVCLILSHQPDIAFFCRKDLENSEYIRRSIVIEEQSLPKEEDDDLPF